MSRNPKNYIKLDPRHPDSAAHKELMNMKYVDLQAAVVSRGMDFDDVVEGDHGKLASWFIKNYEVRLNKSRLEDFDIWMDRKLKDKGLKKSDPLRKYRKFSEVDDEGGVKVTTGALNKAKIRKEKKSKRNRDGKFGIFTGTKKEYTYNLTNDLFGKKKDTLTNKEIQKNYSQKMIDKVTKKYPEAQPKSIKIWMSRCLKALRK